MVKKEVEEDFQIKAFNLKKKNIKKVKDIALKEEGGNSSRAINKIIEAY